MNSKNILDDTIDSIKSGMDTVSQKYDNHIREKAVENVNKKNRRKRLLNRAN